MIGRERERLHITVPSLFRCPISLDVMKSPVCICTGVTYDRSSIQRWLESGHDTCPATMQVLPSKDFVPNLTLRRLISLWSSQASPRRSLLSPPPSPAVSEAQVRDCMERIRNGCTESLEKVADFVGHGEERRRFVVGVDGFVEAVAGVLSRERVEITVLEMAVRVLSLILIENGVKEKLNKLFLDGNRNCLFSFVTVLQDGDMNSKMQSVAILDSISYNIESKHIVAETPNLIPVTLPLINQNDSALNDVVLSFLTSVATNRSVKTQLVQFGLVGVLTKVLCDKNAAVSLVEKSLKILSTVASCKEGRAAISEDPTCAGGIVERLMKVSKTATEDAVLVLWAMCCWFKDGKVQDKVVRSNGLTKVLLVMQSGGEEGGVRRMCGDLVKVLRVGCGGGGGIGSYETKTTHIMPC